MRHFVCLARPVAALACGVGVASAQAGLEANTGALDATLANQGGAFSAAVTVAAITVAAEDHGCAAAGAQVASWG